MPITDERKFVSASLDSPGRKHYRRDLSPSSAATITGDGARGSNGQQAPIGLHNNRDPVRQKLDELHVLLLSKNKFVDKATDDSSKPAVGDEPCHGRHEEQPEGSNSARAKENDRYEQMQRVLDRLRVIAVTSANDRKRTREDTDRRDAHEAELYRKLEEEFARSRQDRLRFKELFQEHLKEREEQREEVIAALRKRNK